MKAHQETMAFKPVTMTFETADELETLKKIMEKVCRKTDQNVDEQHLADQILETTELW
jgi:hypothetical protein